MATSVSTFVAAWPGHAFFDWCRYSGEPMDFVGLAAGFPGAAGPESTRALYTHRLFRTLFCETVAIERTCTGKLCSVSHKPHFQLCGTNDEGVFWTHIAEAYPLGLCRRLARMAHNATLALQAERLDPIFCPVRW